MASGISDRIIQGDALEVLRELPDQSVHCCVTSRRLNANAIESLCIQIMGFHRICEFRSTWCTSLVPSTRSNTCDFTSVLNASQCQSIIGLILLYAKIRQKSTKTCGCFHVSNRPRPQGFAVLSIRFCHIKGSAKSILQKRRNCWRNLSQCKPFRIGCLLAVFYNAHSVRVFLDSNCPVRINCPGKISHEFSFCHVLLIPLSGGDVKC